jgi:hypothetical protein
MAMTGWIDVDMTKQDDIIVAERKSKYKHKITIKRTYDTKYNTTELMTWCNENFGEGGRKQQWRRGWVGDDLTFYFKNERLVTLFLLRWA